MEAMAESAASRGKGAGAVKMGTARIGPQGAEAVWQGKMACRVRRAEPAIAEVCLL